MQAAPSTSTSTPPSGAAVTAEQFDVVVIGGGPAGSTIATLLAQQGWRVVVLDKDRHPRFHIGESLLPHNNPLFEQLGVMDEVRAVSIIKNGAEFNSMYHGKSQTFYFCEALDRSLPSGFQVHRADLDHILLRNAARKGAHVHEETRATRVDFRDDGVTVHARGVGANSGAQGESQWHGRFLVDASGRDTFLGNLLKTKAPNRKHASAALFAHYENAHRYDGVDEGNISIYWFDHGWIWFIPLARGITSVGAVCWPYYLKTRQGALDEFFDATVAQVPALQERLAGARRVAPVTATGNYSYDGRSACGKNYVMVGDAFAFVDPIFSSGVYLAMTSAVAAAEAVDTALRDPARAAGLMRAHERRMRRGIAIFKWFIYRMTSPSMRDLIMYPRNVFGVVQGIISFLAGDIFRMNGVRLRVLVFKGLYYTFNAAYPRRTIAAIRRRKLNIRPVES